MPRWKVERGIDQRREVAGAPLDLKLASQVGTQLLRWGRSDVIGSQGEIFSLVLEGWEPAQWTSLEALSEVMEVDMEFLRECLQSWGRHGERVHLHGDCARAAWTDE